jgi:serine/threonine-protein kinase RsbT
MAVEPAVSIVISQVRDVLKADVLCGEEHVNNTVSGVYASDLMSDVLAYGNAGSILLTGLCTKQAIITAFLALFKAIVFIRGKIPTDEMINFAREKHLVVLNTDDDMFEACIKIATLTGGIKAEDVYLESREDKHVTTHEFFIEGSDFANSGMVSTQLKGILQSIGYDSMLIRRVAISTYEAEMNVVMHALRGNVYLTAGNKEIIVVVEDEGKGIPDIDQAMQRGFSTATEEQRALGFGSGMGLPNIKKSTDDLKITSKVGKGTRIEARFSVRPDQTSQ